MTPDDELHWLKANFACEPALEWIGGRPLAECWELCERGDWMIWLMLTMKVPREKESAWSALNSALDGLRDTAGSRVIRKHFQWKEIAHLMRNCTVCGDPATSQVLSAGLFEDVCVPCKRWILESAEDVGPQ